MYALRSNEKKLSMFISNSVLACFVLFRKLIVRVIDITFEEAEPPRRLYQLQVHQFSKCFVSWPNQKLELPHATVSFQKFITSSGIVLIRPYCHE